MTVVLQAAKRQMLKWRWELGVMGIGLLLIVLWWTHPTQVCTRGLFKTILATQMTQTKLQVNSRTMYQLNR